MEKLTNPEIKLLERLFEDSMFELKLYQPRKITKPLQKLLDRGFAEPVEFTLGGFPSMQVKGYAITLLGHYTYCQYASSVYKEEV